MEEKTNKANPIGSSVIGFLGSAVIENLGAWEFLSERVDEPAKTFILIILSFIVLFFLSNQFQVIIFKKFPKAKAFLLKNKKILVSVFLGLSCVIFALVMADKALKASDISVPNVTVKTAENNIVASAQYETPLVYHVYFEDETKLKEVNFTEDSIELGDITAEININKVSDNEYVLSLSNIVGESGAHCITLKEGIAKDSADNKSKDYEIREFYLYNNENDIDTEAPQINFSQVDTDTVNSAEFNVTMTDNNELSKTRLNEEDLIFIGFSADVNIERDVDSYSVKLTNIRKTDEKCLVVILGGVATDSWKNVSKHTINNIDI